MIRLDVSGPGEAALKFAKKLQAYLQADRSVVRLYPTPTVPDPLPTDAQYIIIVHPTL